MVRINLIIQKAGHTMRIIKNGKQTARQTLKKQSLRKEHRFGDGAVPKTFLPKIQANILPARKLQVAGRTMTAMPLQNILVHQARAKTAAV